MKNFLTIAILASALSGFAEDNYLYWMIDNPTISGGTALSADSTYYAKIKVGGDYLNLYDGPGTGPISDNVMEFVGDDPVSLFAGYSGSDTVSFLVELYNASTLADDTLFATATFTSSGLAAYITQGGQMAKPAEAYNVGAFTAVPEPTSGLLLLLGVAGLALRRKKMQKA